MIVELRVLIFFSCVLLLSACEPEYEPIFSEKPDERLKVELQRNKDLLLSAPHGWKASLYTGSGAGYFYYLDFSADGTVSMLSDFNSTTAGDVMQGDWELKALQQISLSFTTYSYLHLPADPDGNVNNGVPGNGLASDFEFSFVRSSGDSIVMKGLQHNAEFVLVRSSEEEAQAYLGKRIQFLLNQTNEFLGSYRSYVLSLPDGRTIPMALSLSRKMISFQYVNGENIEMPRTSYTFGVDGILLKDQVLLASYAVEKLLWDDEANVFYVALPDRVNLTGSNDPFVLTPPRPLSDYLGKQLVTTIIPADATLAPLPGQSEQFTTMLTAAKDNLLSGEFKLTLGDIRQVFVPNTDRMLLVVSISQNTSAGVAAFTAQYTYSYQVREDGSLKFKLELTDNNANLIYADLAEILSHFDNDTFSMQYVGGGFGLIASFFSQEEPDYYFAGFILR